MFASGSPCRVFAAVVPHASNNFTRGECDYLYVGVAGDVTAICSGAVVLFKSLANGWHPIRCSRVNAVGTAATDMVAAYVTGG